MKVKRIFAPDMRQAMKRVRDEIGPQAIIVSNHRIAGGVEVVAAHEQDFERAQSQFKEDRTVRQRRDSQVDILTSASRRPPVTQTLEEGKAAAQQKVLDARSRSVSEYAGVRDEPNQSLGRNKQLEESSYDEDLESILASLKKKKEGAKTALPQESRSVAAAEDLVDEMEEEQDNRFDGGLYQVDNSRAEVSADQESQVDNEQLYSRRNIRNQPEVQKPRAKAMASHNEDELIESMQAEIQQLKKMLSGQLPGAYRAEEKSVSNSLVVDKLAHRFDQIGLDSVFERRIKATVDPGLDLNRAWRKSLAQLVEMVPVKNHDFITRGGMIAFVGPTGVGKTTTIGKLAAKYVLENGSAGVALVTTDSYRIAAHEQLKTFGRILDIPVRVVDENNSLIDVLGSLRNKKLVLIDTAGLGSDDASSQEQSFMLENVPVNLKKLLVLSCSSQKQVLDDAYDCYSPLGLSGCVLTKVDESGNMGAALTLVTDRKLPVAYVASGQKVPDDIHVANKNDLVSRAVLTAQKSREREKIRRNAAI
jgi:flagellar biosynthesis protein FlhF